MMLKLAMMFLAFALVAGAVGFFVISGALGLTIKILAGVFLALAVLILLGIAVRTSRLPAILAIPVTSTLGNSRPSERR